VLGLVLLFGMGCRRGITPEEKAVRAELRRALRERSYEKAAVLAQRVVQSAPQENGGWEKLVRAQLGMRDTAAAEQTIAQWPKVVGKPSPKWHELAGDVALQQRILPVALQRWAKALALNPKNLRVLGKVARVYRAQEDWAAENAAWTAVLDVEENATARIARALSRRRLHRWSEALEDFRAAQQLAPDDPDVRRGAKLFERLGKFLSAIRELDARLAVIPNDDQLRTDRALLFLRSDDPELALEDSAIAAGTAPWAVRPILFQAIALLDLGRAEEAAALGVDLRVQLAALTPEFLETISRLDSEISVERTNPELYVARAWQLNEIDQPALALRDAETALRYESKSAAACAEASYALTKLGRADEAFEKIKRATELDANFSTAWQYRGELEIARGDCAGAIESLTRALAIHQTVPALQKREECYRQNGLFAKAEEDHRALEELTRAN